MSHIYWKEWGTIYSQKIINITIFENCEKYIKRDYFKQVYEADKYGGELKCLLKLTDDDIYVNKIRKMKVKPAKIFRLQGISRQEVIFQENDRI